MMKAERLSGDRATSAAPGDAEVMGMAHRDVCDCAKEDATINANEDATINANEDATIMLMRMGACDFAT